jgi:hypothetical protein
LLSVLTIIGVAAVAEEDGLVVAGLLLSRVRGLLHESHRQLISQEITPKPRRKRGKRDAKKRARSDFCTGVEGTRWDTYFLATVVAVLVSRSVTLLAARDGLSGELTAGCRFEPERRGC